MEKPISYSDEYFAISLQELQHMPYHDSTMQLAWNHEQQTYIPSHFGSEGLEEDHVDIQEIEGNQSFNYEFGFFHKDGKRVNYIKSRVQHIDHPDLHVEQYLYNTEIDNKNAFEIFIDVIEGKKRTRFCTSRYTNNTVLTANASLYPYSVTNQHGEVLVTIHNVEESHKLSEVTDLIDENQEFVSFTHQNRYGKYSVSLPLKIPQQSGKAILNFLGSRGVPSLQDNLIRPKDLNFFVELNP